MMWVRQEDLREDSLDDGHVADMQDWERLHRKYTPLYSIAISLTCQFTGNPI